MNRIQLDKQEDSCSRMSTKASLHYPWQDVLSVWPCTHCMSFYKCWPLLGMNQCCSLFNTSTPVYLTQLVAVHFNATAQYIYQPAGDDVELRASAKLKLFPPPFPSQGWYTEKSLSARFINAKTFTEIWADTKVKLQGKFKRQDPGCAASLPMFSALSTSFYPHSFHFFTVHLSLCKVHAGWYKFLACHSSSSMWEKKKERRRKMRGACQLNETVR